MHMYVYMYMRTVCNVHVFTVCEEVLSRHGVKYIYCISLRVQLYMYMCTVCNVFTVCEEMFSRHGVKYIYCISLRVQLLVILSNANTIANTTFSNVFNYIAITIESCTLCLLHTPQCY